MQQNIVEEAERRRDEGISRAINSAENKNANWLALALDALDRYPFPTFMTEALSEWAYANGCPRPHIGQAWGHVILTAKKQGLIVLLSQDPTCNPRSHRRPGNTWLKIPRSERTASGGDASFLPQASKQKYILDLVRAELSKDASFAHQVRACLPD